VSGERILTTVSDLVRRAGRLAVAIDQLTAFGVTVSQGSRLRCALSRIEEVAASGFFPNLPDQITELVNALEAAEDFSAIAAGLPQTNQAESRKQLRVAIGGELSGLEVDREPYRFQTQHWIGTVLRAAGLTTEIPPPSAKESPDYLVGYLTQKYGVEVKRPMYTRNISANVEKAAKQIASFSVRGAIFLDVSDCLRERSTADVGAEVLRLTRIVETQIWDDFRREPLPNYNHVLMICVFARGNWVFVEAPTPLVRRENHVELYTFYRHGTMAGFAATAMSTPIIEAMKGRDLTGPILRR
jgi:hypothetical protein